MKQDETTLLSEIQLLLAEKRTYLSISRTGLAVFSVPLTVLAFLVAAGDFHGLFGHPWLGIVVTIGLILVSLFGLVIFFQAERKIHKINKMIVTIEKKDKRIAEIVI